MITLAVAFIVMSRGSGLPTPEMLDDANLVIDADLVLYGLVLTATLLLGIAEVFYDNAAQTFMPSIVHKDDLEKANGRLWSVELVAGTFIGPGPRRRLGQHRADEERRRDEPHPPLDSVLHRRAVRAPLKPLTGPPVLSAPLCTTFRPTVGRKLHTNDRRRHRDA